MVTEDSWRPEPEERGQFVNVKHPVNIEQYNFYAERAGRMLELEGMSQDSDSHRVLGVYDLPFQNSPSFGFHPVEMAKKGEVRPLARYALATFPRNPNRTTIIHELLHHMIHQARVRSIRDKERLKQIGTNSGLQRYYFDRLHRKPGNRIFPEPQAPETEEELTKYIIHFGQTATEGADLGFAEEIEVRYFISKYGPDLGILPSGVLRHTESFCQSRAGTSAPVLV